MLLLTSPRPARRLVTIQLYSGLLDEIKLIAATEGIPYQALIQRWLVEKLRENKKLPEQAQ